MQQGLVDLIFRNPRAENPTPTEKRRMLSQISRQQMPSVTSFSLVTTRQVADWIFFSG
jgi:hypothetical protein